MVVGSAAHDGEASFEEFFCQHFCVLFHLLCPGFEFGLEGFFESHGFGGDDVFERSALDTGEDG